jgi:hypothetical protein
MSLEVSSSSDDASCASCGYPPTPTGSDVDQLEYYERIADWLYTGNCTGTVGKWRSNYWRQMLDSVPGAGEYYRALVEKDPLRELVAMRYGAYLAGQAAREHYAEQQKNERAYCEKKQKSKRHGS